MTTSLKNQERLAGLRNRPTLYELVLSNGPVSVLVAYCSRKGRDDVLRAARDSRRGPALVALTGADNLTFARRAADGATMGAWVLRFSGRTQRDALAEGELPYVVGFGADKLTQTAD